MRSHAAGFSVTILLLLLVSACADDAAVLEPGGARLNVSAYSEWSPAVNFGPQVNSAAQELTPAFTPDGQSLYFLSNRPGGAGGDDLWVSQRQPDGSWGEPLNLGSPINTAASEAAPSFSRDGHWMYFASNRSGSVGLHDMWATWRTNPHDDFGWQEPINLSALNTSEFEGGASVHGSEMYFSRGATMTLQDIWVARMQGASFTTPMLVPELSSAFDERRVSLRLDGREILMHSNRPGGLGLTDIWLSTREGRGLSWTQPVNAGPAINSSAGEQAPMLSHDGLTLLFISNRPGGQGGFDIYYSTRAR